MELQDLPKDKKIILFDGVCNLCDSVVQYVIRNDKKDEFRFAALQSEVGLAITKHIGVDRGQMDSIILYEPGIAYFHKSDAALEIAKTLGGFNSLAVVFKIFPLAFRNRIYDYIANNRYKWYGKKESCMIPRPEITNKFL